MSRARANFLLRVDSQYVAEARFVLGKEKGATNISSGTWFFHMNVRKLLLNKRKVDRIVYQANEIEFTNPGPVQMVVG